MQSKLITKIDQYRKEKGISQEQLGEMVDVRRETIVRLEKGQYNPSLKLAYDISKVFNVAIEDLFEFVSDEEKS